MNNDIDIDLKPFPLDFEKAWKNSEDATRLFAKRITLKKFKHSKTFSRETMCFTAQVWIDGRNVADANNDGNGGETNLYFADHSVERNYNDEVKQRLEQWDGECRPIGIVDVIDRVAHDMVEAKDTAAYKKKCQGLYDDRDRKRSDGWLSPKCLREDHQRPQEQGRGHLQDLPRPNQVTRFVRDWSPALPREQASCIARGLFAE
jgi:hypothetical protein